MATVRLNSTLRGQVGLRVIAVSAGGGTTVGDAVDQAVAAAPALGPLVRQDDGLLRDNILVLHNGRNIRMKQGLATPMATGDTVDLFPKTGLQRAFAKD